MAEVEIDINAPKKSQTIKSSILDVFHKAQSSLSPTRKSDSSLLKSSEESSKQSENHLSQKLWSSLKRFSSSATDFSKHTKTNWSTSFFTPSPVPATEAPAQPQSETNPNTCNSSTSTQSLNPLIPERKDVDEYIPPESKTTQVVSGVTCFSYSPAISLETQNRLTRLTTWHVTPATPDTIPGTPADESPAAESPGSPQSPQLPVFDWSNFDWNELESDPPRGLIFPFPIRPISRSESCQSVLMGNTGSQSEFEY